MAVLGRVLIGSAERLDLADLLSIDSYTAGDFKYLIKSMAGDTRPYILKGFEITDPGSSFNYTSCSISVADSVVYWASSNVGSFFYGLPAGNTLSQPLTVLLKSNTTNYVFLTFNATETSQDSRAYWDPDKNAGAGGEFNQDVNTESVLVVEAGTSVSVFPDGTIPIAKITTDNNGITSIQDCRDMMFRLGTGGAIPNPHSRYTFKDLPSADYMRLEPPTLMQLSDDPTPFQGGDKNIASLKEWMDVVMTKLAELSGTPYWYQEAGSTSVASLFQDTLGSNIKSKGTWLHDIDYPGKVTWTEDIVYTNLRDKRDIIVRADSLTLANEQVAYIELIREADINVAAEPVRWFSGLTYIQSATDTIGSFALLKQGDWVKKKADKDCFYARVEQFYSTLTPGASTCVPASAKSIRLSKAYTGVDELAQTIYTKGEYPISSAQVVARDNVALVDAGGNMFWLASRSDTIVGVASVVPGAIATGTVLANDGVTIQLHTAGHGLISGDRIIVDTSTGSRLNGTYQIEYLTADTFSITTAKPTVLTTDVFTAKWSLITTAATTNGYGFQIENADSGLEDDDTVIIAGLTGYAGATGFNGTYSVKVHNISTPSIFQIPCGATGSPVVANATVSCVDVFVRKPFGAVKILQGESIDIGEVDGENIQKFIGMASLTDANPTYAVPGSYSTLEGFENFNADAIDNLTVRASKLSAMMADRVQDRGTKIVGAVTMRNTTSARCFRHSASGILSSGNQILTCVGSGTGANTTITIIRPKIATHTINLTGPLTLAANTAVVATIDRKNTTSSSLSPTVESIGSTFLIDENKVILFYRLTGSDIYGFDGQVIVPQGTHTFGREEHSQNKNVTAFYTGEVDFDKNYNGGTNPAYEHFSFTDIAADVIVSIPGSAYTNTLDTSAFNGSSPYGHVLPDNQFIWVRIDRAASKVFNTVYTSDQADTNANGGIYITTGSSVPQDQDVFVLYQRIGDAILSLHRPAILKENIYDESLTVTVGPSGDYQIAPCPSGTTIYLPPDSRDSGNDQSYIKGAGELELYLNGQYLKYGVDWLDGSGSGSVTSTNIVIQQSLVETDILTFRDDSEGGIFFGGVGGGAGTLQEAYDGGNTITTVMGAPVTIVGPTGETALVVNGDLEVDGVIDPIGMVFVPQVSTPISIATQAGVWVDSATKELMYQPGDGTPPTPISVGCTKMSMRNATGLTLLRGAAIGVDSSGGNMAAVNVRVEASALSVLGILNVNTDDLHNGPVIISGIMRDTGNLGIGTLAFGDTLYVAPPGEATTLTNIRPNAGIGGFLAGDFVVKVGTIVKDPDSASFTLAIGIQIVGQL